MGVCLCMLCWTLVLDMQPPVGGTHPHLELILPTCEVEGNEDRPFKIIGHFSVRRSKLQGGMLAIPFSFHLKQITIE